MFIKTLGTLILAGTLSILSAGWDPSDDNGKKQERKELVSEAKQAISKFKKKDPKMNVFFDKALGYAVFPSVGKGGMGIGGAYGKGVVFKKGRVIGYSSLVQVTFGFQLGGQVYSEIIFFKDRKALNRFIEGNFELGAQASAVAIKAGAAANVDYNNGVAIFTMAKGGLMYEASVGGQKFDFERK